MPHIGLAGKSSPSPEISGFAEPVSPVLFPSSAFLLAASALEAAGHQLPGQFPRPASGALLLRLQRRPGPFKSARKDFWKKSCANFWLSPLLVFEITEAQGNQRRLFLCAELKQLNWHLD